MDNCTMTILRWLWSRGGNAALTKSPGLGLLSEMKYVVKTNTKQWSFTERRTKTTKRNMVAVMLKQTSLFFPYALKFFSLGVIVCIPMVKMTAAT